jgi:hypothetical protein
VPHRQSGGVSPRTLTFVIVLITIVWAINFTAGIVIQEWQASSGLNAVMMAVIGLLGAARFRQTQAPPPPPPVEPPAVEGATGEQ